MSSPRRSTRPRPRRSWHGSASPSRERRPPSAGLAPIRLRRARATPRRRAPQSAGGRRPPPGRCGRSRSRRGDRRRPRPPRRRRRRSERRSPSNASTAGSSRGSTDRPGTTTMVDHSSPCPGPRRRSGSRRPWQSHGSSTPQRPCPPRFPPMSPVFPRGPTLSREDGRPRWVPSAHRRAQATLRGSATTPTGSVWKPTKTTIGLRHLGGQGSPSPNC
mmetsp:Transcript_35803/g.100098  ORF Transcript_35803/g.100098 Transcript_35803/m.100098 type:complete len:217 (-) Transcript_35803:137-787(-)